MAARFCHLKTRAAFLLTALEVASLFAALDLRFFLAHAPITGRAAIEFFAFLFAALRPIGTLFLDSSAVVGQRHYFCRFHK